MKKIIRVAALSGAVALALAACGSAPEDDSTPGAGRHATAASVDFKACMVSDSGGFDDKSFNQSGAEGLERAGTSSASRGQRSSRAPTRTSRRTSTACSPTKCNLIIGVGFLLEDPIQTAAEANPDVEFALVDTAFSDADFKPVTLDNGKPLLFNTQEAAFLAGYVAAAQSTTGTVATFGGIQLPSVTIFMDGFSDGVAKYNEDNGKSVQLLGWDKAAQTGVFAGNFDSQDDGKNIGQSFIDQGADIIMPVAGPVGLGTAVGRAGGRQRRHRRRRRRLVRDAPEYGSIVLTSVIKEIGQAVFDTIEPGRRRQVHAPTRTSARSRTRASTSRRSTTSTRRSRTTSRRRSRSSRPRSSRATRRRVDASPK